MNSVLLALASIALPATPENGLCVDQLGNWYLGHGTAGIVEYTISTGALRSKRTIKMDLSDEVDLFRIASGLVVVDYARDRVRLATIAGKTLWVATMKSANGARIDAGGTPWILAQGGALMRKTKDSSEFEPLLNSYGEEVAFPNALDFVPTATGMFLLDEEGAVSFEGKHLAALATAQRILESQGGIIAFCAAGGKQSIVYVASNKTTKTLWSAPSNLGTVSHFSRIGPGRVLIAGPTGSGGFAEIVNLGGGL